MKRFYILFSENQKPPFLYLLCNEQSDSNKEIFDEAFNGEVKLKLKMKNSFDEHSKQS